jgi:KaiC/GvpD/RAD55 family RecA-like ATPase
VFHDVAILRVSPLVTEARSGQLVNVEVTVRNKGTAAETFNITLYSNTAAIGVRSIVGIMPDSEASLSFIWNTTGLADGGVYSLRAETGQIRDDIDPANNVCTFSSVKISGYPVVPEASGGWWDTLGLYVAAPVAILILMSSFLVAKKLRKPTVRVDNDDDQKLTQFQLFSDGADGGLPDAYSVMIVGEAAAEKSVFCQQVAYGYLKQGKQIIYVTYDRFPDEVRKNMKDLGWDVSYYELESDFTFVDAYSFIAGKQSKEKYSIKQPFSLSELGIAMSRALNPFQQKPAKVFLDSTAPLFTRLEPSKVVEFLQDRCAQVKGENAMFLFTVGKGTIQESLQSRLEEMVDCIIELEVREEKRKTIRRMYVKKLRGQSCPSQLVTIDVEDGLAVTTPTGSRKSKE